MIGQVTIGKSFGGLVRYVMEKEGAEVLDQSGVRSISPVHVTQDFNAIRVLRSRVKNAVWHTSISFAYQDNLTPEKMIRIGSDYLQKIGLDQNQYLIVRHHDTDHQHIHIISNRIGFDGSIVSDNWCKNRTAQICDQLEKKYGLTIAKDQGQRIQSDNHKVPLKKVIKTRIKEAIIQTLQNNITSFEELSAQLKKKGIKVNLQVQFTGRTNGISFKYRGMSFKGSAIDRSFSFGRLAKELSQNARQNKYRDHDKRGEN